MRKRERVYLIQNRCNGKWIFTTPVDERFLENGEKVRRSMAVLAEMPGTRLEYRYAEMKTRKGQLVAVGFYDRETFENLLGDRNKN